MYTNFYNPTWSDSVNHANSDTYRYNNGMMSHSERRACEARQEEARRSAWYGKTEEEKRNPYNNRNF